MTFEFDGLNSSQSSDCIHVSYRHNGLASATANGANNLSLSHNGSKIECDSQNCRHLEQNPAPELNCGSYSAFIPARDELLHYAVCLLQSCCRRKVERRLWLLDWIIQRRGHLFSWMLDQMGAESLQDQIHHHQAKVG